MYYKLKYWQSHLLTITSVDKKILETKSGIKKKTWRLNLNVPLPWPGHKVNFLLFLFLVFLFISWFIFGNKTVKEKPFNPISLLSLLNQVVASSLSLIIFIVRTFVGDSRKPPTTIHVAVSLSLNSLSESSILRRRPPQDYFLPPIFFLLPAGAFGQYSSDGRLLLILQSPFSAAPVWDSSIFRVVALHSFIYC